MSWVDWIMFGLSIIGGVTLAFVTIVGIMEIRWRIQSKELEEFHKMVREGGGRL